MTGMTTPIISGGMNALRLPASSENTDHSNVILTGGGGAFGRTDGPKQGAISCRHEEEAWLTWKSRTFGDIILSDGLVEYAKTHVEIKCAFLAFQTDADQMYPGLKEKLGYTGESSVQATSLEEAEDSYPTALFDRIISDGRAMLCFVLNLSIGNNPGMGDVDYGKI